MKNLIEFIKKSNLYNESKKIVIHRGSKNPKILFIGEAPGVEENNIGKPFVGKSGKLLDKWIDTFELNNQFAIINAVPLIPLDANNKIRKPIFEEIEYFKPLFIDLIKKLNPKIIICLGDSASMALMRKPIKESRNKIYKMGDKIIISMYHPSYYLRNGRDGINDFETIYKRIKLWL